MKGANTAAGPTALAPLIKAQDEKQRVYLSFVVGSPNNTHVRRMS